MSKPHITIQHGGRLDARVFLDDVEVRGLRSVTHVKSIKDAEVVTLEIVADSVEYAPYVPSFIAGSPDDEFECQLCGLTVRRPFMYASECRAWPRVRRQRAVGFPSEGAFHQWTLAS